MGKVFHTQGLTHVSPTDLRLLAALMYWVNKYQTSETSIAISRRGVIERRIALVKLVNDLLASPRLTLYNRFRHDVLIDTALESNDEELFMKLLDWPLLEGNYLRIQRSLHRCYHDYKCTGRRSSGSLHIAAAEVFANKDVVSHLGFSKIATICRNERRNSELFFVIYPNRQRSEYATELSWSILDTYSNLSKSEPMFSNCFWWQRQTMCSKKYRMSKTWQQWPETLGTMVTRNLSTLLNSCIVDGNQKPDKENEDMYSLVFEAIFVFCEWIDRFTFLLISVVFSFKSLTSEFNPSIKLPLADIIEDMWSCLANQQKQQARSDISTRSCLQLKKLSLNTWND